MLGGNDGEGGGISLKGAGEGMMPVGDGWEVKVRSMGIGLIDY